MAAPLTLLGTVVAVLLGGGFCAPDVREYAPQSHEDGGLPPELAAIAGDVLASGAATDAIAGGRSLDGYAARPGLAVTTPSRRIERVYAKRDQTLADIAQARGVSVAALLWAGDRQWNYAVEDVVLLKEVGVPLEQRLANAQYIAGTGDNRLTLVTCWPYGMDDYRLAVIARPG